VEAAIKKETEAAYKNPELAEEEKNKGNELFKKGDFSGAIKHYSEAIKRNPEEPKIYSNRAACYTKLMSFDLALKDTEKAISLYPTFVKGYLRKANALNGMSKTAEALSTYEKALEIDPNCGEAIEGYKHCMGAMSTDPEERRKLAMNDPEVQRILSDPAMRMILDKCSPIPHPSKSISKPEIAQKFMKLKESGLISVGYK
ncbi:Uncharacterized protein FKW44_022733, partial [Caligus rogercresseyi]